MSNVYERFITANHALFACYDQVDVEAWKAMNAKDQANVCATEQAAVRRFLQEDSVHFRTLIQARIESLASQQH